MVSAFQPPLDERVTCRFRRGSLLGAGISARMSLPTTAPFWCSKRWEFEPNHQCSVVNSRPNAAPMWCRKGGRRHLEPSASRLTRSAGRGSRELAISHLQAETTQPAIVAPFSRGKDMGRCDTSGRQAALLLTCAMVPPRHEWAELEALACVRCCSPHVSVVCAIILAVLFSCL